MTLNFEAVFTIRQYRPSHLALYKDRMKTCVYGIGIKITLGGFASNFLVIITEKKIKLSSVSWQTIGFGIAICVRMSALFSV